MIIFKTKEALTDVEASFVKIDINTYNSIL